MQKHTIAFIGAGNVATHLAHALQNIGHTIVAVCTRTATSAQHLATSLGTGVAVVSQVQKLPPAELYIIAASDDAIEHIAHQLPICSTNSLVVHTSGSIPIEALSGVGQYYGVLYPLQTFSKERQLNMGNIPYFVEGNTPEVEQLLFTLARSLSPLVQQLCSEDRARLHLSAVFACNFTNHLYDLAAQIVESSGVPPEWLHPLIQETAAKIQRLSPHQAQTGPARRGDQKVIAKHLEMLSLSPQWQELYQTLSKSIYTSYHQ